MDNSNSRELSRRTILRQGAVAAGATSIGIVGFSETALASDCPRTPGFWANHNWCEIESGENSVGENVLSCDNDNRVDCENENCTHTLHGETKSMDGWQDFLTSPMRGDKGKIMAKHLLALRLNWQRRSNPDPTCVDKQIDLSQYGLGETTIRKVKGKAENWLEKSDWPDSQRGWLVDEADHEDGEQLKDVIDAFNNGNLEALDCDCD